MDVPESYQEIQLQRILTHYIEGKLNLPGSSLEFDEEEQQIISLLTRIAQDLETDNKQYFHEVCSDLYQGADKKTFLNSICLIVKTFLEEPTWCKFVTSVVFVGEALTFASKRHIPISSGSAAETISRQILTTPFQTFFLQNNKWRGFMESFPREAASQARAERQNSMERLRTVGLLAAGVAFGSLCLIRSACA